MKILITGGCGFIGTNLALYFLKKGCEVIVIDNLSRKGSELNAKLLVKENKTKRIKLVVGADVARDFNTLQSLICDDKVDVIIHTAAQVAVTSSVADPVFDFDINAKGTLNVLEAARSSPKKPIFIYTSTNKVYGKMEDIKVKEKKTRYWYKNKPYGISELQNLNFHSPYGCSKGCADQYVRDYYRIYDFPTIVFRQSCIYGLHQFGIVDQGWISYLTISALFEKPIIIYGNGKQVRDVLFMDDLGKAFELAIKNIDKTKGQIYNIGGGPAYTVSLLEFICLLEKMLSRRIEIEFTDWRPGDQKVYISDIRKAKRDFNWKPKTDLVQGLKKMIEWIEKNKAALF